MEQALGDRGERLAPAAADDMARLMALISFFPRYPLPESKNGLKRSEFRANAGSAKGSGSACDPLPVGLDCGGSGKLSATATPSATAESLRIGGFCREINVSGPQVAE